MKQRPGMEEHYERIERNRKWFWLKEPFPRRGDFSTGLPEIPEIIGKPYKYERGLYVHEDIFLRHVERVLRPFEVRHRKKFYQYE